MSEYRKHTLVLFLLWAFSIQGESHGPSRPMVPDREPENTYSPETEYRARSFRAWVKEANAYDLGATIGFMNAAWEFSWGN